MYYPISNGLYEKCGNYTKHVILPLKPYSTQLVYHFYRYMWIWLLSKILFTCAVERKCSKGSCNKWFDMDGY